MQKPETFRSFAKLLYSSNDPVAGFTDEDGMPAAEASHESDEAEIALEEFLRDIRLFRARLSDIAERSVETLLERLAEGVLARELAVSAPEIETIVERSIAETITDCVLSVRVHPGDAPSLRNACIPVVEDATLNRGDAVFEVANGTIADTLSTRLSAAISDALTAIT